MSSLDSIPAEQAYDTTAAGLIQVRDVVGGQGTVCEDQNAALANFCGSFVSKLYECLEAPTQSPVCIRVNDHNIKFKSQQRLINSGVYNDSIIIDEIDDTIRQILKRPNIIISEASASDEADGAPFEKFESLKRITLKNSQISTFANTPVLRSSRNRKLQHTITSLANADTKHTMTGTFKSHLMQGNRLSDKQSSHQSDVLFKASESFDENVYTGNLVQRESRFTVVEDTQENLMMTECNDTPLRIPKDNSYRQFESTFSQKVKNIVERTKDYYSP